MSCLRVLWLAGLMIVASAGPAAAQPFAQGASPVVGSGSFGNAPNLSPGTMYSDSVRPGEILYYSVSVKPGQVASIRVRRQENDGTIVYAGLFDSLRRFTGEEESVTVADRELFRSPVIGPEWSAYGIAQDVYGPGEWYIGVMAINATLRSSRYEVPLTLQVEVGGDPVTAPAQSPSPEASPTMGPDRRGLGDRRSSAKPSLALVGGVSGAGLLAGGLGAARIRRR